MALEAQIGNPVLSPSLNEKGPALLTDENDNHLRTIAVVFPDVNGACGLTAGVVADGQVSQVTARQDDAVVVAAGKAQTPVVALVSINPATGAKIPFTAPASASAAKVTGKFQSVVETGTGAAQNVPHGLGVVPTLVLASVYDNTGVATVVIVEGAHDITNLKFTVSAGAKFKCIAFA